MLIIHLNTHLILSADISSHNKTDTKSLGEMGHAVQLIFITVYVENVRLRLRTLFIKTNSNAQNKFNIILHFKQHLITLFIFLTECSFEISIYIFWQ